MIDVLSISSEIAFRGIPQDFVMISKHSVNGLVPSHNNQLPEPMLAKTFDAV